METIRKDPLGSAWVVIAALSFTVMNLSVKAASTQFGFSSGELVFWRMLVSTLFLGIMAKAQATHFPRRIGKPISTAASSARLP